MMYVLLSLLIGGLTGFISYRYEKTFIAIVLASLPITLALLIRVVLPMSIVASETPSGREGDVVGEDTFLSAILETIDLVPHGIKLAIFLFPVFLIAGRMATWVHAMGAGNEDIAETREQRKRRIHSEYDLD